MSSLEEDIKSLQRREQEIANYIESLNEQMLSKLDPMYSSLGKITDFIMNNLTPKQRELLENTFELGLSGLAASKGLKYYKGLPGMFKVVNKANVLGKGVGVLLFAISLDLAYGVIKNKDSYTTKTINKSLDKLLVFVETTLNKYKDKFKRPDTIAMIMSQLKVFVFSVQFVLAKSLAIKGLQTELGAVKKFKSRKLNKLSGLCKNQQKKQADGMLDKIRGISKSKLPISSCTAYSKLIH